MNGWLVAVIAVGGLLVSALLGYPLTSGVLRLAARSADAGGSGSAAAARDPATTAPDPDAPGRHEAPSTSSDGPTGERAMDTLRGGTWIGVLERLAVTGAMMADYPSAIAFVIAVKGLGRYPELRENPGASERFVIGTLASMLWAVAVGALARHLLGG
ncbi:MAG: hypothetical protein JWP95_682 [Actinotalea sp.]|nr:hypothetical protein [Actinotalea sp.]